jgi:putative Mg2+ transporter-C (MgtC) family protein
MSELGDALRIVGSAGLLGACLGLERELARKPAGLRTHVLVAVSAAALMIVGSEVADRFAQQQDVRVTSDPLRVIEAVIVGISFLGAGTIVQAGARIEGLTTAASILVTAAIGLAVATGQAIFAAALTFGVLAVLLLLGRLEHWLGTAEVPQPEAGTDSAPG